MNSFVTIYIQLLNEGTIVYRPTLGEPIDKLVFKILPTPDYDPNDEHWEFVPGEVVKCQWQYLLGTGSALIAVERLKP